MVCKYIKKNTRANWTVDDLRRAVKAVNHNGQSISIASRQFKIPWSTIRDHVIQRSRNAAGISALPKNIGRKPVFNEQQEAELLDLCIEFSKNSMVCLSLSFEKLFSSMQIDWAWSIRFQKQIKWLVMISITAS